MKSEQEISAMAEPPLKFIAWPVWKSPGFAHDQEQIFLLSETCLEANEDKAQQEHMQKDKKNLSYTSYKNAAYTVHCSRCQWSQITSRVNLDVKHLKVNNIKRQISHTGELDRI